MQVDLELELQAPSLDGNPLSTASRGLAWCQAIVVAWKDNR